MIRRLVVKPEETGNKTKISIENIKEYLKPDDSLASTFIQVKIDDGQIHGGHYTMYLSRAGALQLIDALIQAMTEEIEYATG